ncbi:hypothetical protein [Streptomyces chryseus]|uniref:hypothetical protein n=1 Tax=Streptomyces chryseus TaxID=68186 RepID=UPI00110FB1D6|nr:hypothetical protein [Streptomyces chryseus]GGX02939.1 hypothetical protein GCM10010353_18040 [Streptomyces chryseus]
MRKFMSTAVAAIALCGSLGLTAGQATAVTNTTGGAASEVVALAAKPSCVKVRETTNPQGYELAKVHNKCDYDVKLKAVFKGGWDSSCHKVKAGKKRNFMSSQPWTEFDKMVTC